MRTLNQGKYFSSMYFVFLCILCSLFSKKSWFILREKNIFILLMPCTLMYTHNVSSYSCKRLKRADLSCLTPPSCDQLLSII